MIDMFKKRSKILAIGSHPDDIENGCGGSLSKLREEGHEILAVSLSNGGTGLHGNKNKSRPAEPPRLDPLGIKSRNFSFPDNRFQEHVAEIEDTIEKVVAEFEPDIIFTQTPKDGQRDHRIINRATATAMQKRPATILCYENCHAATDFSPTLFIKLESRHIAKKTESLRSHESQDGKPFTDSDKILASAIFRGAQAYVKYAEAFEIMRVTLEEPPTTLPFKDGTADNLNEIEAIARDYY